MLRKILYAVLALFIIIQFFRPKKNTDSAPQPHHISGIAPISTEVKTVLQKACNDCHSNNTVYPWYAKIQPVAWWLNNHIVQGKKELNLDEYTNRSARYQYHKMEETIELVKEGGMPLDSYTWTHRDAKLTDAEKAVLVSWAEAVMDSLKNHYPLDSLIRRK